MKDDEAALIVRKEFHRDWSHTPPVIVADEWPKDWETNMVVVTPVHVIGTESLTSFSISAPISELARKILNTYINLKRAQGGGNIYYRDITAATGLNRRYVYNGMKELESRGIGIIKKRDGFTLNIGSWRPDAAKAKELGIEIKEW